MVSTITNYLLGFAAAVPVPAFVMIGAFVEEVIAPIPSPIVMTLAGSIAETQGKAIIYLLFLAAAGAVAKTFGSWIVYIIVDKAEDVVMTRFGRILGVSHKEVEGIGKLLNGGSKDDIVLFLLRAIPIVPTAPVSIVGGLIKVRMRTFLNSTFWGYLVRNVLYLYLGYSSVTTLESLNAGLESWESVGYIILFVLIGAGVAWLFLKRGSLKGKFGL